MVLPLDSRKALKDLERRISAPTPPVPVVSVKAQVEATKLVVQNELKPLIERLNEVQSLASIQPKDGKDGRNGLDGKPGPRGLDGAQGSPGIQGKDGKNGKDGQDGKPGVSVVGAEIAVDDHLVFKLSDGRIIDVGELPSLDSQQIISTSLQNQQVTVSATEPEAPSLNDLWLDIS